MNPDPRNPEHRALVEKAAARLVCPECGHGGMDLEWRLQARPIGSFSLAGAQMKFSAREVPVITCPDCGLQGTPSE